jgi:hypothetical protein
MEEIISIDDEDLEDSDGEMVFVWECGDGFLDAFKPEHRINARRCENLAREERHTFCYLIPTLRLWGTVHRIDVLQETLTILAKEHDEELSIAASVEFRDKWGTALLANKHLIEITGNTVQ